MAKVILYSKDPCPYCVSAKRLLAQKGVPFTIIDLTYDIDQMLEMKQKTGWQTMPIILINDKVIGGYDDLRQLEDQGKLDALLS